ncbi:MAG: FAD:protein FMN transferase, partial [Marivivens sp.]|nr:FAD:protein FMN transferase [Marivivens sp.]
MCSDRCHNLSGETMGTARWHAQFWLPEGVDPSPYQSAFQEAVDTVDAQMSLWKPQSDLCRLNAAPVGEWVTVPFALFTVLDQALTIGRLSGGAFDIAVGRAVEAWGFGPKSADADHLSQMIGDASHIAAHDAVELDTEG